MQSNKKHEFKQRRINIDGSDDLIIDDFKEQPTKKSKRCRDRETKSSNKKYEKKSRSKPEESPKKKVCEEEQRRQRIAVIAQRRLTTGMKGIFGNSKTSKKIKRDAKTHEELLAPITNEQRQSINQTLQEIVGRSGGNDVYVEDKENTVIDVERDESDNKEQNDDDDEYREMEPLSSEMHRQNRNKDFPENVNFETNAKIFNSWIFEQKFFNGTSFLETVRDEIRMSAKARFSLFGGLDSTNEIQEQNPDDVQMSIRLPCTPASAIRTNNPGSNGSRHAPCKAGVQTSGSHTITTPQVTIKRPFHEECLVAKKEQLENTLQNRRRPLQPVYQIIETLPNQNQNETQKAESYTIGFQMTQAMRSTKTNTLQEELVEENIQCGTDILDYLDRVQKMTSIQETEVTAPNLVANEPLERWSPLHPQQEQEEQEIEVEDLINNFGLVKPTFNTPSPPPNFYQRMRMF